MKGIVLLLTLMSLNASACFQEEQCQEINKELTNCEIDEYVIDVEACFEYVLKKYPKFEEVCEGK